MSDPREPVFDALRDLLGGSLTPGHVTAMHSLLDGMNAPKEVQGALHMLSNPAAYFVKARNITGALDQAQVDTMSGLFEAAKHWPIGWMAYGLATAWHEARMKPIEEWGKGKGRPYGKPGKYGQSQHGRGLVQLTWDANYERADKELNLGGRLLKNFNLALQPEIAANILVRGMEEGWFTGKKLGDYISDRGTPEGFKAARRIINGTDKQDLIADLAEQFRDALDAGGWG